MKPLLTIGAILIFLSSSGQKADSTFMDNYLLSVDIPGDTTVTMWFYKSGQIRGVYKNVFYSNDSLSPIYHTEEHYCENGQLKYTIQLPADTLKPYIEYHCNGQVAVYSDSSDFLGQYDGIVQFFNENGILTEVIRTKFTKESLEGGQKHIYWSKYYDKNGELIKIERRDKYDRIIDE